VKAPVPFRSDNVETCVKTIGRCPVVCQFVPFALSHLYCYSKKHKHFGVCRFREGRQSVVNTVKVAVVDSISLHHQQCEIFIKIKGENVMWTGAVISYEELHCLFADWFPFCRCLLHFCEGQRTVSAAKQMEFGPAHSEKFPLYHGI